MSFDLSKLNIMQVYNGLEDYKKNMKTSQLYSKTGLVVSSGIFHLGLAAILKRMVVECDYRILVVTDAEVSSDFLDYLAPFNFDALICVKDLPDPLSFKLQSRTEFLNSDWAVQCIQLFNSLAPKYFYVGQIDYVKAKSVSEVILDFLYDVELKVVENARDKNGILYSVNSMKLLNDNCGQILVLNRSLEFVQRMVSNGQRDVQKLEKLVNEFIQSFHEFKLVRFSFYDALNLNKVNFIDLDKQILVEIEGVLRGLPVQDNLLLT